MSAAATFAATAASLVGLAWLAASDPKRRRAFHLRAAPRVSPAAVWTAVLLPGGLVPIWSGGAGFVIWLGAVSLAGWGLAAWPPGRASRISARLPSRAATAARLTALVDTTADRFGAFLRPDIPASARTGLEGRITALEAEVAALRRQLVQDRDRPGDDGVVVDLAGRR